MLFKGSQIFGQKNKGSQIFRRKFKGSQINFKVWPIFFSKFTIFWKIQIQTSQKLFYNFRNRKKWLKIYPEKIRSLKMLGFSEEKTPGGYSPLKMTTPLRWSNIFNLKEWTWSATKLKKNHTCFYPAGRIHHMSIILLLSTKQPLLQGLQYSTTKGFPSFTDSTPCVSIFLI